MLTDNFGKGKEKTNHKVGNKKGMKKIHSQNSELEGKKNPLPKFGNERLLFLGVEKGLTLASSCKLLGANEVGLLLLVDFF